MSSFFKSLLAAAVMTASCGLFAAGNGDAPYEITAFHEGIGKGKIRNRTHSQHRKLGYAESGFFASYNDEHQNQNGTTYGIGFKRDTFNWNHKKMFHQKHFNNLLLSYGGYIKELENWQLDAKIGLAINTDHFSLSRYTLFKGFLQGKYRWKDNMNLYIGLTGVTGMRSTYVLPIIGFDYKASEKWRYNFVLPYNISAIYTINEQWSCNASLRPFYSAQRLEKKHEHNKRGIINYRNTGAELGLRYKHGERITAGIHIGETFGGRLRISHRNGKDRKHLKVGSAGYTGAMISIGF